MQKTWKNFWWNNCASDSWRCATSLIAPAHVITLSRVSTGHNTLTQIIGTIFSQKTWFQQDKQTKNVVYFAIKSTLIIGNGDCFTNVFFVKKSVKRNFDLSLISHQSSMNQMEKNRTLENLRRKGKRAKMNSSKNQNLNVVLKRERV